MFQFEYHYTFVFKTEESNWDNVNYTDYWYIMADFDMKHYHLSVYSSEK